MRRLVLVHQHEWLVLLAIVLQPIERLFRDYLRSVSRMFTGYHFPILIRRFHRRIVIRSLSYQYIKVVVSLRG